MIGKFSKNIETAFKLWARNVTCHCHTGEQQTLQTTAKEFSSLARGMYEPLFDAVL
jgi:hypothetical protein